MKYFKYKHLIIPDVHEQYDKLCTITAKYNPLVEQVTFLGDFMDSFDEYTKNTENIVYWLQTNLSQLKYNFCVGNHDIHYMVPKNMVPQIACSGYDPKKYALFQNKVNIPNAFRNFKIFHWLEAGNKTFLCSHAGLHPNFVHTFQGYDRTYLVAQQAEAFFQLKWEEKVHPYFKAGYGRGGSQRVGGPIWLDWSREFDPIEGLNQIVGHSPSWEVRIQTGKDSINYCLDTNLNNIMLIDYEGGIIIENV
jgi:hypothetical protein